jgi:F0F1-type ATP synthase beta subunit
MQRAGRTVVRTGLRERCRRDLLRLSSNRGGSSITTIVVHAVPREARGVWAELSPPYKAQIVRVDRDARRKLFFPSIDPLASLSDLLVDGKIEAIHVDVASVPDR